MNSESYETTLPKEAETELAKQSARLLSAYYTTKIDARRIQLLDADNNGPTIEIPTFALKLLQDILSEIGNGNTVRVIPVHAELTTQEAADILNVSRPHVVKLMEEGILPCYKVGKHRRIKFEAIMEYKKKRDQASQQALDEITAFDQEFNLE